MLILKTKTWCSLIKTDHCYRRGKKKSLQVLKGWRYLDWFFAVLFWQHLFIHCNFLFTSFGRHSSWQRRPGTVSPWPTRALLAPHSVSCVLWKKHTNKQRKYEMWSSIHGSPWLVISELKCFLFQGTNNEKLKSTQNITEQINVTHFHKPLRAVRFYSVIEQ